MKKGQPDKRREIPKKYKPSEWLIKAPYRPQNKYKPSERDEIYTAIGKAISTWEILECILSQVFIHLSGSKNRQTMQRSYGSILASKARLNMIQAAGKSALSPKDFSRIRTLVSDIAHLGSFRNQIAHGTVAVVDDTGAVWTDNPEGSSGKEYILTPPVYNTGKIDPSEKTFTFYTLSDIEAFIKEARKLQVRAANIFGTPYETTDPETLTMLRFGLGQITHTPRQK